jgi:sarcosine oxidase subunit beta
LTTTAGEVACGRLVLTAGAWSAGVMRQLGIELPVGVRPPQMILTKPMPPTLRPVIGSAERKLSLKQLASGSFLIGGGWPGDADLETSTATPRPESIRGSLADATAVYPEIGSAEIDRVWVGIEAQTPDAIPVLGLVPGFDNLSLAAGFSGHGFALSPVIGQVLSELATGETPSIEIGAFSIERFGTPGHADGAPKLDAG